MQIYSDLGIDDKKIEVIPNFYDPDFPAGESPKSLWDSDSLRVLYVGRLTGAKSVNTLIKAVEGLGSVDLRIVGEGPEESRLKSLASNPCSNVSFEGWVEYDRLHSYYKSADVFVHPATWPEPFGRSVLESLQCGTPAIVSQIGAPPWIVGDAGLTFEPGNQDHLTSILSELRENQSRQRELATNCSHRVEQFSPDTIIPQVQSEYQNLIKADPSG
jgi:glycosyltransferase involved in cell wall biosynthesis